MGDVGGRLKREGIYVHLKLTHAVVLQKSTQHCKAIIFQLRLKKNRGDDRQYFPCILKVKIQIYFLLINISPFVWFIWGGLIIVIEVQFFYNIVLVSGV